MLAVTVAMSCCLALSAYGGHVDPRVSAMPSLLTLALPYVAMAMVALTAMLLLLRQWRSVAVAGMALVACAGPLLTMCPPNLFEQRLSDDQTLRSFKVMTLNAKYFRYNDGDSGRTQRQALEYLAQAPADVVLLQEACAGGFLSSLPSADKELIGKIKSSYPYQTDDNEMLAILSRYPFTMEQAERFNFTSAYMHYKVYVHGREVDIVNVHLQSFMLSEKDKQFYRDYTSRRGIGSHLEQTDSFKTSIVGKLKQAFRQRADQADIIRQKIGQMGRNVIVCGDFNDTPCSYAWRTMLGDDFTDAYSACAFGPTITYHERKFWFRIDHILYRGDMQAVAIKRGTQLISDHYPLVATMVLRPKPQD